MFKKLSEAEAVAGKLSMPSKMPGYSYSLPASTCSHGARLAQVPGTVCHGCYALKGRYVFPAVQAAMFRRFNSLHHPDWVNAMAYMIQHHANRGHKHFRWHDSGDLQGTWHLVNIIHVCEATPKVHHWLPTRELKIVRDTLHNWSRPSNLTIRVSAHTVDTKAFEPGLVTSMVYSKGTKLDKDVYRCPAKARYNNTCGPCRACWNPNVEIVAYPKH